jgi:hypothetical protein
VLVLVLVLVLTHQYLLVVVCEVSHDSVYLLQFGVLALGQVNSLHACTHVADGAVRCGASE